jgi:hypothetical protein
MISTMISEKQAMAPGPWAPAAPKKPAQGLGVFMPASSPFAQQGPQRFNSVPASGRAGAFNQVGGGPLAATSSVPPPSPRGAGGRSQGPPKLAQLGLPSFEMAANSLSQIGRGLFGYNKPAPGMAPPSAQAQAAPRPAPPAAAPQGPQASRGLLPGFMNNPQALGSLYGAMGPLTGNLAKYTGGFGVLGLTDLLLHKGQNLRAFMPQTQPNPSATSQAAG